MPLPLSYSHYDEHIATLLSKVNRGNKEAIDEFVWQYQERFYAIAMMATNNEQAAIQLTIDAFKETIDALKQLGQTKDIGWDWLSDFIVKACQRFHAQYSSPTNTTTIDPSADGSAQLKLDKTINFDPRKIKMCLSFIPEDHKKVFVLRHQLDLAYDQIAIVLNQNPDNILGWLFRARVQLIKCLEQG